MVINSSDVTWTVSGQIRGSQHAGRCYATASAAAWRDSNAVNALSPPRLDVASWIPLNPLRYRSAGLANA